MILTPTETVIALLNESLSGVVFDGISPAEIYLHASGRGLLPQLHALFLGCSKKDSKLKSQYHWRNLQATLIQECKTDPDIGVLVTNQYLTFFNDFGRKHLLVGHIDEKMRIDVAKCLTELNELSWYVESSELLNDESPEADTQPLTIAHIKKSENNAIIFILHEKVPMFSYVSPDDSLLSDAGRQFKSQIRLKKRTVVTGVHKVVFSSAAELQVCLIDPSSIVQNETAADKAAAIHRVIFAKLGFHRDRVVSPKWISFFPAIRKLYEDKTAGEICGGYFYTSTGSRFLNNSRGTGCDLREDPFQQGGEKASPESIDFVKLDVVWSDEPGEARVGLHGSSEMFEHSESSLPWIEVIFSADNGGSASFLKKVLDYANW